MAIKVLFVDDHEMVRIGISSYLSTQQDIVQPYREFGILCISGWECEMV